MRRWIAGLTCECCLFAALTLLAPMQGLNAQAPTSAVQDVRAEQLTTGALRRPVTLSLADVRLEDALTAVSEQAGISLSYSRRIVPTDRPVTLRADGISAQAALERLLRGTNVGLFVSPSGQVSLGHRPAPASETASTVAQEPTPGAVAGRISGPEGGAVADASIHVQRTAFQTVTDVDGRFRITGIPAGTHDLVVQYIGYRTDTVSAVVRGGETTRLTITMDVDPVLLGALVVEGQVRGQARALNQQRTALNIRNVIAEEQVERFPDANIADGLKRVPGIAVSQDYGEAQGVMIRGIPSALNSVTINGERVPSNTVGGRGVNLANILSDMVGTIEIQKALTPDMDADAIGGTVNLLTKDPMGERPTLRVTAATGYNELRSRTQTDVGVTYGQRFGKVGVLVAGSYLNSYRQEESLHYAWNDDLLGNLTLYNYQLDRDRYGASGTFQYDMNDRSSFFVRAIYNKFEDRQYTPKFTLQLGNGSELTGTSASQAPTSRTGRQRDWAREILTLSAGGEHDWGGVRADYRVSYGRGGHDQPRYFNASWLGSPADFALDLSDPNFPVVTPANGSDPYRESAYSLNGFSIENEEAGDRDYTAALNVTFPFRTTSVAGSIKVGGKYRTKESFRVARESAYSPADGTVISLDQYPRSGFGNSEFYGNRYDFGPGYDPGALSRFFQQNPQMFDESVNRETVVDEYDAREDVAALYGMAVMTLGRLTTVAGVRYERTTLDYDANEVVFDADGAWIANNPLTRDQSYGDLYPSLHLRYRLTDRTNLRGAVTRALARPSYSSLAPYELVLHEDNEIERGNPDLRPYESTNLDLIAEHYLSSLGIVSVGVFYKDLGDVIVDQQYIEESGPYTGYEVVQPANGSDATVWGWEASWQQQLSFLPGALSGLGIYVNYSFTDSEMNVPGAERKVEIPEQIPHVANVALLYEKFSFSGSLSLHYQDGFIDDLGSSHEEDEYFGSRVQLDASVSQRILPQLRVFGEINNITDEPYQFYLGRGGRNEVPLENAIYGRWATLGLRYDF